MYSLDMSSLSLLVSYKPFFWLCKRH